MDNILTVITEDRKDRKRIIDALLASAEVVTERNPELPAEDVPDHKLIAAIRELYEFKLSETR